MRKTLSTFAALLLISIGTTLVFADDATQTIAAANIPPKADTLATPVAAAPAQKVAREYKIGVGDVLRISVYKEPDASVDAVTVRSDGKISMPLIKDVDIAGLTASEAEKMVAQRLSRYIQAPDVTVILKELNSAKVYIVGAVRTVGRIDLRSDMTVLQAIAQSGGLTEYAKRKQIYILRDERGQRSRIPFNYDAVLKGGNTDQNVYLNPNDVIVVP
jgi:polysaccharide biosynthesis/export protein